MSARKLGINYAPKKENPHLGSDSNVLFALYRVSSCSCLDLWNNNDNFGFCHK